MIHKTAEEYFKEKLIQEGVHVTEKEWAERKELPISKSIFIAMESYAIQQSSLKDSRIEELEKALIEAMRLWKQGNTAHYNRNMDKVEMMKNLLTHNRNENRQ